MGEVIYMSDVAKPTPPVAVKPKTEAHRYKGHTYILSYRPQAAVDQRWQWHVKFTRVYEFAGSCATIELGTKAAKAKINSMIERTERVG